MKLLRFLLVMAAAMFAASSAFSSTPNYMNVQGILTNAAGVPLLNVVGKSVDFAIYDVDVGGAPVWGPENHLVDTDGSGRFSHILGNHGSPITDADFDGGVMYLGITVDGDPELIPRIPIVTSGYAFRVATVDGASGGTVADRVRINSTGGVGGYTFFDDETSLNMVDITQDADGTGGYIRVWSSAGFENISLDGNLAGSTEPGLLLNGSTQDVLFDMSTSGSPTVILPDNAIRDFEILNEPGVASDIGADVSLSGVNQNIATRTIDCPTSGYVLAVASCNPLVSHTTATTSVANFGVSDVSATFPPNQDGDVVLPGALPTGTYQWPITNSGLFSVAAGLNTFYYVADEDAGAWSVFDIQFSLVFINEEYGTVDPTLVTAGAPEMPDPQAPATSQVISEQDIAAEQAAAKAFHDARQDQDLAALKAELEQIKKRLGEEADLGSRQPQQQ